MSGDPVAIARACFAAWKAKDYEALRALLSGEVALYGPLGIAYNADQCIAALKGLRRLLTDIVILKMLVDGNDVLTWFELHTSVAPPAPMASWSHVEDGVITGTRVTFDPRDLIAGRGR
jgi:SnoaL-like domain